MKRKCEVAIIALVVLLVVGMFLSYTPSTYYCNFTVNSSDYDIEYVYDSNYGMGTNTVLIETDGNYDIQTIIALFDSSYASMNDSDTQFKKLNYMKDYFDVVKKSQNCSFVSYLENEDIKNDFIPKNLSVLVKKMISIPSDKESAYLKIVKKRTFAEVVCPKILNFYGCETVFNECLVTDNIYVLSLDFIKPNQTYYALMDLKGNFQFLANGRVDNNVDAFKKQIEQLKHLIANNENLFFKKQPTADVDEMTEKLVYSWLIRCILLGDTDFSSKNFGLIYDNVKNEITSAPNYDFEFCVKVLRPDFVAKNGMIDPHGYFANIKYVMENYPSVYKKFIEKTKMISSLNPKTGNRFYEDFVYEKIQDEIISEKFCEVLKSNISYIFKNDKKLEKLDSQLQM